MTKPRSFRLTPEAQKSLTKLAADYKITENKVINLLLTEQTKDAYLENTSSAAEIIENYFTDMILQRQHKPLDKD